MPPVRSLPVGLVALVKPKEGPLLQYIYQKYNCWSQIRKFMRHITLECSFTLSSDSLRNAILASAADRLPAPNFKVQYLQLKGTALRALMSTVAEPAHITESDAVASLILAYMVYEVRGCHVEALHHASGCLSILKRLSEGGHDQLGESPFRVFRPFIINCANSIRIRVALRHAALQAPMRIRQPPFNQLVNAQTALTSSLARPVAMNVSLFKTMEMVLHDQLEILISCTLTVAAQGNADAGSEEKVTYVLQHVAAQLGEPDFQECLSTLGGATLGPTTNSLNSVDRLTRDYFSHQVACAHLL